MTEIELHQDARSLPLTAQIEFARAVTAQPEHGARSLLPDAYKGNPGNVLLAVGLGQAMGLNPAESLWRIDVIQGKPAAAAELIASNVRKAGHKLRVKVTEDPPSATCTIIRADDPDEPTTITRDMEWAKRMGLTNKDNYKKQPSTMLSWRAISACARLACPEALYGVSHTPDELYDLPRSASPEQPAGGLAAALQTSGPEAAPDASSVEPTSSSGPESVPEYEQPITDKTRKHLFALMGKVGIGSDDDQRQFLSDTLGREVASRTTLTEAEGIEAGKRLRRIEQGDADAEWTPTFDAEEVQQ